MTSPAEQIDNLQEIVNALDWCEIKLGDKLNGFEVLVIFPGQTPRMCRCVDTEQDARALAMTIQPDTSQWRMEPDDRKVFVTVLLGVEIAIRTLELAASEP